MAANETDIRANPETSDMLITREFDAPRELVFKAFTDPILYVQWFGPRKYTMKLETFQPESGGQWRYTHTDQNDNTYAFRGVYHEVLAPERIIHTFEFEGHPEGGHVGLETITFQALPHDRTRFRSLSVLQSVADRDFMLQGGAKEGVTETYNRLAAFLKKAQQ